MRLDALLFDFDGVIVESADIKTEGFRAMFSAWPAHLNDILSLHQENGGVDRYTKIDMIYRDILHEPLSTTKRNELADAFSAFVLDRVVEAPLVAGMADVLAEMRGRVPMAVVSGTPQSELTEIVERKNLASCFTAVCGTPPEKAELVARLLKSNRWQAEKVLLIGDSMTDFTAAQKNATLFVGRVRRGDANPFPSATITIEDFVGFVPALNALPFTEKSIGGSSR